MIKLIVWILKYFAVAITLLLKIVIFKILILIFVYFLKKIENSILSFGKNEYGECATESQIKLNSIYQCNFFGKQNIIIKKINCGGNFNGFTIFLTGLNI
jgi:hypothetical protein